MERFGARDLPCVMFLLRGFISMILVAMLVSRCRWGGRSVALGDVIRREGDEYALLRLILSNPLSMSINMLCV